MNREHAVANATPLRWYMARAGRLVGPIQERVVQQQLRDGTIGANEPMARAGDAAWRPAAQQFPDYFPANGPRSLAGATTVLVLAALSGCANVALTSAVAERVVDPGVALAIGASSLTASAVVWLLAAISMLWVHRRWWKARGTGLKTMAGVSLLAPLPGAGLALLILANTVAADKTIDPHHLSLNEQGEVLLVGGIGRTLAHDLQRVLAEHHGPVVLVLDSPGGRIGAAEDASALLRARGPFTARVDGVCASACVLLMSAAATIELYSDSLIGLHRPSIAIGRQDAINTDSFVDSFVEQLERAGFGPLALAAARQLPSHDMLWLEPITHADVLPSFQLLDEAGDRVPAELHYFVLAREALKRHLPEAVAMLDLVHESFPAHVRARAGALLASRGRRNVIDAELARLLEGPFDAAVAGAPPELVRAWLAALVEFDEQFDWATPADACYGQANHPEARSVLLAHATEVMRAAAERDWPGRWDATRWDNPNAVRQWPLTQSRRGAPAIVECRHFLLMARAASRASDHMLRQHLAHWSHSGRPGFGQRRESRGPIQSPAGAAVP